MSCNSDFKWLLEDYQALAVAATELKTTPSDLLLVLHFESGLDPHCVNSSSGARGLNQITWTNGSAMKLSGGKAEWEAISTLSVLKQLPYVVRSFKAAVPNGAYANAGALYLANIAPAFINASLDRPIYVKGTIEYDGNHILDYNHDGVIDRRDINAVMYAHSQTASYKKRLAELNSYVASAVDPRVNKPEPWVSSAAPAPRSSNWLFVAAFVGAVAVAIKLKGNK
jgi:hypothetical protein